MSILLSSSSFLSCSSTYESYDKSGTFQEDPTYHVLRACGDLFSSRWVICFCVIIPQEMPMESRKLHDILTVLTKATIPDKLFSSKGMIMPTMRKSWHSDPLILFQHWNFAAEANQNISYTGGIWGKKCPQLLFSWRFSIFEWVMFGFFASRAQPPHSLWRVLGHKYASRTIAFKEKFRLL